VYPNGEWTAFYSYSDDGGDFLASEHRVTLTFTGEDVAGTGRDEVGPFTMTGTAYGDRVEVIKQYFRMHAVGYSGRLGFRGCIVGRWRIGPGFGGRFLWAQPGADAVALALAYAETLGGG
jgi:hypothetical protein